MHPRRFRAFRHTVHVMLAMGMTLLGSQVGAQVGAQSADRSAHRWSVMPDASVRQLWETSEDGGKTWSVTFDGKYVRRR